MDDNDTWLIFKVLIHLNQRSKHIEQKLDVLLQHLGVALPPELVQAGNDLDAKTKALQAALDAQASQPKKKET